MSALDWSQCPAVESDPDKMSGAWVLRGTRMPVQAVMENLQDGMSIQDIADNYAVTAEEIEPVFDFIIQSLDMTPSH